MYDILIQRARVYDGSGTPPFVADVAVSGGKIVEIEKAGSGQTIPTGSAAKTIPAEGLCLSPGFIDVHSHSDDTLLICPTADSKLYQGVTTDVFGNCGFSVFPITDKNRWNLRKEFEPLGVEPDWEDLAGYRRRLDSLGLSVNVMTLIGHGTLRSAIVGFDDRVPSEDELKAMTREIEKAMDQGASGLSSGLQYPPGLYAGKEEIQTLARATHGKGGIYTSHMRSEGDQLIESVEETIETGAKTGIPVIVSHLKATGHQNWGRTGLAITLVEIARRKGMEVAFDRYPYLATSTGLDIFMPPWAHDGGREKLLQRLKSGDEKLFAEYRAIVEHRSGWDAILISDTPSPDASDVLGKTVTEIARERGTEPWKTAIDLLIEGECRVGMCNFSMCQEDTDRVLAHPYCMIGSDASAVSPRGVLGRRKPHPRAYGTFPRFLSEYARDRRLVPVEEAIRRITALPAQALGLKNRGQVEKGYWADLVLFRLERLEDRARFGDPHHFPAGIEAVVVNGQLALEKGTITDARPGQFLSREG
jgi:N-acyl-D-amino-acid deacylase